MALPDRMLTSVRMVSVTESRLPAPTVSMRHTNTLSEATESSGEGATALEAGYSPASLITNLNDPVLTAQGEWVPEDEHSNATSMTLRTALRTSSNRAAVQLLNTVGISQAVSYAEKLNVGTPPSVPSLALGASDEVEEGAPAGASARMAEVPQHLQPSLRGRRMAGGDPGRNPFHAAKRMRSGMIVVACATTGSPILPRLVRASP